MLSFGKRRSSQELDDSNQGAVLANTIWRLPLIYIFMFVFRFLLTAAFQPLFKVFLGDVSWRELVFATVGGLRGSVSLILAQAVVTDAQTGRSGPNQAHSVPVPLSHTSAQCPITKSIACRSTILKCLL